MMTRIFYHSRKNIDTDREHFSLRIRLIEECRCLAHAILVSLLLDEALGGSRQCGLGEGLSANTPQTPWVSPLL